MLGLTLACGIAGNAGAVGDDALLGRVAFTDRRDPPPWRALPDEVRKAYDLGLLVFNTTWVVSDSPNAARIDGLGPLFINGSCDGCHNNGARGRPSAAGGVPAIGVPGSSGTLSNSFVMQLGGTAHPYGNVLNTAAISDHAIEGLVAVDWTLREGRYGDGSKWSVHGPTYRLTRLLYGPPDATTVLRPRVAPAVYGAGLLQRVPAEAIVRIRAQQPAAIRGTLPAGRFGWQGEAHDIEEQTARAFAREMGLTSQRHPADDCSAEQVACRASPQGGLPEVSDEFLHAIVTYQRELAIPLRATLSPEQETQGRRLFGSTGCVGCHVSELPVDVDGKAGRIDALSDLLLHDLGDGLADRDYSGKVVKSSWRTAPLWGLAHARRFGEIALLHDGRATSVEQAILWHGGQAEAARDVFLHMDAQDRAALTRWVDSQ